MFKKPLSHLKSFSPLRSSDRRRFQNEAYNAYPHIKERCSQEGAKPLMPDTLQSAKFSTHNGVNGVVHVADNKPLWLKLESLNPVPTVYTLWEHPDILPAIYTVEPVIEKLIDGADLMIPGVFPGPDGMIPDVEKGELVAIKILGYDYPLAVGTMALSSRDIRVRSDMKGKAVHLIHVYRDYLWTMGDKSDPPTMKLGSEENDTQTMNKEQEEDVGQLAEQMVEKATIQETQQEKENQPKLSSNEVDEVLKNALLYGLLYKLTPEKAASQLPISASTLYSAYVLPCRPRGVGSDADIKQSSWKKLQKFLKTMEKHQILKMKEHRGEIMLTSINFTHPSFQSFNKYKTIESAHPQPSAQASDGNDDGASTSSNNRKMPTADDPIVIQELYQPRGKAIVAFFDAAKHSTDKMYSAQEVRGVLSDFVKENGLANPRNQKLVKIDPYLCDAILKKQEYHTIHDLTREQIIERLLPQMQPFHLLTMPGKEPELRKGNPKPIMVTQEFRMGRKTVTKVVGLEQYDVDVNDMCKDLTKLCASSATHNPAPGSTPKNPIFELLVQGPQFKHVQELLLSKGVPKKMIVFEDKTNKKKSKK
ncbi:hypothetical protein BX666DRAFT_1883530 [Dichotomocladium elegans]|nr:hypothetical protein BX666DRAFT_1883530 [Dichotomocladium elegans]